MVDENVNQKEMSENAPMSKASEKETFSKQA